MTQVKLKHQHYLYAIGLQQEHCVVDLTTERWICPEEFTLDSMKSFRTFHCITGTKHFGLYMKRLKQLMTQGIIFHVKHGHMHFTHT